MALNHAADGINAIVGGDVYTGTAFPEQYQGDYFFNDLGGGIVRTVSFNANGQVASVDVFTTGAQFVVQIKQGPDGNLYFVNLVSGEVGRWTFAPSASLAGFEAASAPIVSHGTSPATGQGAVVALIDSGLDATHPDLVNVRWKNLDEINGDGIDNDNNGYVDDRFGYDFIQNDGNLNDSNGHGTAMTGIIAANDNGVGFVGFAPEADIMMLRVIDDSGLGLATDVALAIRYAVDNGADVINLPLVVQDTQGVRDAIAYAESNDVLIIVAAGNGSAENPDFPAFLSSQHANVLAVGAVGPDGQPLPESNRVGENGAVQVNALGVAAGTQLAGASTFRGTGVAASVVSSAAALAIELNPSLSAEQLRQLLVASAISDSNGSTGTISFDEVIDRAQRSRRFRFVETGSTFIVHGTDGNESFEVQAGASTLWVDGIEFDIPVGATRLTLQSRGGKDVLRIVGTAGDDIVTASDGYVRLKSLANNIRGNDFANVLVEGDDGIDVVRMQGTVNDDWFAVQEDRAAMRLGLEGLVATSFEKVRVNGGAGDDTAFILGTTENDQLTTRPGKARLLSGVLDFDFQKVESIVVDAVSSSGNDNASLRATTDDDSLEIGTTYALLRGATFQTLVLNFDATSASMGAGNDTTTLVDIDEPTALANHTILGGEAIVDGPSSGTTEDGLPESLDADSLEAFLQSLDLLI